MATPRHRKTRSEDRAAKRALAVRPAPTGCSHRRCAEQASNGRNSMLKAGAAALTGTLLLAGGLSSLALWSSTEALPGGQVMSGEISITAEPGTWADASSDLEPDADRSFDPSTDQVVPGDTLSWTVPLSVTAKGKNSAGLIKLLGIDTSDYHGYLDTSVTLTPRDPDGDGPLRAGEPLERLGTNPTTDAYDTYFFTGPLGRDRGYEAQVIFTFDADTPDEYSQQASADLSQAAMSLTHLRPLDTDSDGLIDRRETALGTDPTSPDTDSDGAGDAAEVAAGTDPLDDQSRPAQ